MARKTAPRKTSAQLDREIATALARPRSSAQRHATKLETPETPEDSWLIVMDALMKGDAARAAEVWNRFYYENEMTVSQPPARFTKALKSTSKKTKIDKAVLDRFKQLAPRYEAVTRRNARLVQGRGMGGYLDPPEYPTHTFHVETDLERRPHNRGSMSLAAAKQSQSIDPTTRNEAIALIDKWEQNRPALNSPKVREWIAQVLRHFGGAARGVELIQKFYPEYDGPA